MKQTIILFFFLSISLQAQWQKTDYGFVSKEPVLGDIRWIPNENAIISSYKGDYTKMDLSTGEIVKSANVKEFDSVFEHISNDLTKSISIKSKALIKHPKVYLVFDFTSSELDGDNNFWNDTILFLDEENYNLASYNTSFMSLNDSIVAMSLEYKYYAGQEYWRDITFFYNLKRKTYISYKGIVNAFNPLSNLLVMKSVNRLKDNPDIDTYKSSLYSFDFINNIENTYSKLDKGKIENVIIGNQGKNAIYYDEENITHFQNNDGNPKIIYTNKLENGIWFLSNNESYAININSNSNDNKLSIYKFGSQNLIDSISFTTTKELSKFLFIKDDYVYVLDKTNRLNKILIPFFSLKNIKSEFYTLRPTYQFEDTLSFEDISAGSPTKWQWYFGDGTTSNEQNPTKLYTETGEYTVSLIVKNEFGFSDTLTKDNYIKIIPKLEALFTYEILTENPLVVRFSNESKGDPIEYVWNFGDGNLAYEENPVHLFIEGIYDISLKITDEYGDFDQVILLKEFNIPIVTPSMPHDFDFSIFTKMQLPTISDLIDVEFFNEKKGIIVSESGEIYITKDGGISWIQSESNKKFKPNRLRFLSNGDAIIVGDRGTQIKSFDFGKTWVENTNLDTNRNIVDFDCISPFECRLLTDINLVLNTNNKLETESEHQFKAKYTHNTFDPKTTTEALKSIMAIGDSYVVGTGAIYVDKINTMERYFHTLMKTTNFESYEFMIYSELMTDKKGVITELEKLDSINVLYSLNNEILYYFYTNSSYPPYEILKTTATFDKFYSSLNQIVVPLSDGNLVYMDSLVYDMSGFYSRKITIKIDDSPLYDYHQITPTKGIAIGEGGKYYITDFTTGVETQTNTPIIEVYPNPITDVVNIHFSNMMQVESLEIYGITGNLVESISYSDYTNNIIQKTDKLTTGVYFIKIITSSGVFHKKIIKF
ncbi:MAG: PKD domain-containing protein [Candidatus Kapaibacterium sp.]